MEMIHGLVPRSTQLDLRISPSLSFRPCLSPHADFVDVRNGTPTEVWHERTLRPRGRVGWLRGWRVLYATRRLMLPVA